MRHPRIIIIVTIFGCALLSGVAIQRRIRAARLRIDETQAQLAALSTQTDALKNGLESRQSQLQTEIAARDSALESVTKENRQLAAIDPDSPWAEPPARLPDWNVDSPYVWLQKDALTQLPITPFSKNADLAAGLASALAFEEKDRRQLSQTLRDILQQYQSLETAGAQFTTNHLPDIMNATGRKATIILQPVPEEAARLKNEFAATIKSAMGEKRGELVAQLAEPWLHENLSLDQTQPKTISAVRHPNGTLNITIKSASNWMSVGGPTRLEDYVPSHLLHFFAGLEQSSDQNSPSADSLPDTPQ
jgi:hypothetical protein